MKKYGAVAIADFDQQRRGHILNSENGGVANVRRKIFVQRHFHALLPGFDVIGFGDADAPVMIAVKDSR